MMWPRKLSALNPPLHENRRFRLPHCRLKPSLQRTPANIRINFMLPETRVNGLHFCRGGMGLSSFNVLWWAPKDASFLETECVFAVQGHPRSLILAPIERAYAASY